MRRTGLLRAAMVVSAVWQLGCGQSTSKTPLELRAALALFAQFETVFSAQRALLSDADGYKGLTRIERSTLRSPFAFLQQALESLDKTASAAVFDSSEVVLVGAKDFMPPAKLGPVRSQSCYVIVLRDHSTFDIRKYTGDKPATSAGGSPVWNWSAVLGEFGEGDASRPSSLYIAQIGQSYVLVANSLPELQSLADRLASRGKDSPQADLRDWEAVSRHDVWAYRRYCHSGVVNPMAAGMADVTSTAEAIVFFVNSDTKSGVVRIISSDNTTAEKINAGETRSGAPWPPLTGSGTGVWETTIPFTGDEKSAFLIFDVVGLFGFATYL